MKEIDLFIPITPVPKGRPRFSRYGHSYTPSKTREYEALVSLWYEKHCNECFEDAIRVYLTFYMPIPKSTPNSKRTMMIVNDIKHTKKPDTDNLVKGLLDALNGYAYKDDSQITVLHAEKKYGVATGIRLKIIEDVE